MQPLDLLTFSVLKSQHRKWLSGLKLSNNDVTEEQAVCKIVDLNQNLSEGTIIRSWRSTGLTKFKNIEPIESLESVSAEQIQDDINERLEELNLFGEEWNPSRITLFIFKILYVLYFEIPYSNKVVIIENELWFPIFWRGLFFENLKIPNILVRTVFRKSRNSQFFGLPNLGEPGYFGCRKISTAVKMDSLKNAEIKKI